jgi:16S rRNA A1518/A1519 N6-dimethyltransferase RsmA/KsgA/DIM1 with predicted DNA glycosylase/AP lyase activity
MEIVDVKVLYQQYYTPPALAKTLVELACIRETDYVLEPSAGQGAIVQAIIEKPFENLTAVEIDPNNYNHLWANYFIHQTKRHLVEHDFLTRDTDQKYNRVIANPPFSKSQDVKHILEMYEHLKE